MVRILTNYTRLLSTLLIGIVSVPLTLAWLGDDAFGLVALLGSNIGLAAIFRQIIGQSLVRELAAAHHGGKAAWERSYPAICRLCFYAAAASAATFGVVAAAVPLLNMPAALRWAAFGFVIGQAIETVALVLLSPVLNMYIVNERFFGYSVWFVSVRLAGLASILVLGYVVRVEDARWGLFLHGVLSAMLAAVVYWVAAWRLWRGDRRLRLRKDRPKPGAIREVAGTFSWNSGVQVAMNLHEQLPPLLLNLAFGPLANAAWGVGFRLVAYIRMVTTGMQFGSDAISARLAAVDDAEMARSSLRSLLARQTRLTGLVSLPAGAAVLVYCFPIMHHWVGSHLTDYNTVMEMAVMMARILAIALSARAVSDTWVLVMYGAGHIRAYARLIIAGGLIAPVLSIILVALLPDGIRYTGPAIGFTTVFVGVHFLGLPFVVRRVLHVSALELFSAMVRPFVATLLALALGIGILAVTGGIDGLGIGAPLTQETAGSLSLPRLGCSIALFLTSYAVLAFAVVLGKDERARLFSLAKRLRRRG